MKFFYSSIALLFVAVFLATWFCVLDNPDFISTYHNHVRTPLFSAFITIGSFLLTLKSAILQRLKDGYDSDDYLDNYLFIAEMDKANLKPYYYSLKNMSSALAMTVVMALVTSLAQMTIGFSSSNVLISLCVTFAIVSILVLLYLWCQICIAHTTWLKGIEAKKQKEIRGLENSKIDPDKSS